MKRIGISMAVIGSALAVAGCGNNGGTTGPTGPTKGQITASNSAQVAAALLGTVGGGSGGSGGSSATMRAKSRRSNFDGADCWTVSGDQSDADGDGLPADATFTYANCSYAADGWTETYSGSDELKDTTPTTASVDYTDQFDVQFAVSDSTGDSENDHLTGLDTSASGAPGAVSYVDASSDDYSGTYESQSYSGNESDDLTYAFTANDSSWNPLTDPAPAGSETISGSWSDTFGGQEIDTNVSTPTALAYDPACNGGDFTAGQIVAASSDGSSVTITWNGCNDVTETYQGGSSGSPFAAR